MKKINEQILYSKEHYYASFPAVLQCENSELLVFFRISRDTSYLFPPKSPSLKEIQNSVDHLDPRSQIVYLRLNQKLKVLGPEQMTSLNIEAADQDPSVLKLKDGSILLTGFSWYPINPKWSQALSKEKKRPQIASDHFLFWGSFYQKSLDQGQTWLPRQSMPELPLSQEIISGKKPCFGGPLRGSLVEDEGIVYCASYSQYCYQSPHDHKAQLFISKDGGNTFKPRSIIAADDKIAFFEPSLYMSPSKNLFAFMRSSKGKLALAKSRDFGFSWEPWKILNIEGEPFHVLSLKDSQVFLSYGYRKFPFGIRGRIIDPECENIETSEEFIIRHDGLCGDIGYPWTCQLEDESIYCVYYFCTKEQKNRHIAASQLIIK